MIQLICIDLDGTLLNTKHQVSERNKKAIQEAIAKGVKVAIVSGRPNCFTIRIMDQISDQMGHITFNGAYYRIADKTKQYKIDDQVVKKLASMVKKHDAFAYFKNKNLSLATKTDQHILDYDMFKEQTPIKDRMDMYYEVDVEEYLKQNEMAILKILFFEPKHKIRELMKEVRTLKQYINIFEYDNYVEMSAIQSNKGLAIVNVCQELNIPLSDVMCVGDNFNDIPMFEVAGLAIAMENAPDAVKQVCHELTKTNDEDGVACAIEKHVLEV